ncbi:PTS system mannose/fructose/sorbose family transporter subunit IID [Holdemania massiliensis]|uniref:PTS system mannose/fructose/sorbose family transporter subunit IID n=1 Tax=Holdemania massiliensis TaxID=1468449 RepID=UPI0026752506|nr:PTS system mannose/fructose/sorbose family transporter subunit IID [Holdemania massiliensis]
MLLNALLLSLIYLVSRTDMINGYMMLTKPIVLGPLVGLVLGDLQAGILIGATLELAFIGVMNIGISVSMDVSIATIVGGGLAILSGQDAAFALTIAIPVGILFNMLKTFIRVVMQYWIVEMQKACEVGDYKKVERYHWLTWWLYSIIMMVLVFGSIYLGTGAVQAVVDFIPQWIYNGLKVGTSILPALGFAMLLNMIWTREIGAFYFIGFVLSAFLGMTNTGVAILGAAFAVIAFFFIKSEDTEGAKEEVSEENRQTKRLSRKALMGVYWRAHTLEASFNYQNYQGSGYCYAMIPALRELYPDQKDLAMALSRHYEFFNTTPQVSTLIFGISCAMEEEISSNPDLAPASVNAVKAALMGPLAGIGDSLFQGTFRIIAAGVSAQLGLQGNVLAPFVFIVLYNAPHFLARWYLMWKSYDFGSKFINKIYKSNIMDKLTLCFGILGLMVIGAMTMSMVSVSTPLVIQFGQMEPLALQSLFDEILPGLLPLCITWATAWLLKKQVNMLHIMIGMFILGIVCNVIGIL